MAIKKGSLPKTKEGIVKGGSDSELWEDIESTADKKWSDRVWRRMQKERQVEMATAVRFVPSGSKKTIDATLLADDLESYAEKEADRLIKFAEDNGFSLLARAMEAEPVEGVKE